MKPWVSKNLLRVFLAVGVTLSGLSQQCSEYRPTEQDFLNAVREWAGEGARDCGVFRTPQSLEPAIPCVTESLERGEPFSFVHYPQGVDSFVAEGLAGNGSLPARRFSYDSDVSGAGGNPGDSRLSDHDCPDPRIRKYTRGEGWTLDCGPRPSWLDYQDAVWAVGGEAAVDCGAASSYSMQKIQEAAQCVESALQTETSFVFRFSTQVDDDTLAERTLVTGPGHRYPQLFWFQTDYTEGPPFKSVMVQRDCPFPTISAGFPLHGRYEGWDGVEVDCR